MSALEVSMEMYQRGYRFINVDIQHSKLDALVLRMALYCHHS